jgi:8-amino-7-oxononanoate synthase
MPAALAQAPGADKVAGQLARLQGCEAATLGTSTLHVFWDLFSVLADRNSVIYADAGVYPIARWGVERAASRGVAARNFPHHDPRALWQKLRSEPSQGARPLVVADGFCPGCGQMAPIAAYLEIVRSHGGLLVLDDTQALGIFGNAPGPDTPYGREGGGSLPWWNIRTPGAVVVSSLAKGFGVPMAVLSGSDAVVQRFEARSETRMHCSPPSLAVMHAAEHALKLNQEIGDQLRLRLAKLVSRFRQRLVECGFSARGGLFPVQTLSRHPRLDAVTLHGRLWRAGIGAVLHRGRNGQGAQISFVITARHSPEQIDHAVAALQMASTQKRPAVVAGGGGTSR